MFHCSVIKVPVVLATAILDYHIFLSLSRTFLFFRNFFLSCFRSFLSFATACVSLFSYQGSCRSRDSHIRLSHLFELVKNFFIFSKLFSELFPLVSVIRDSQSRLSHLSRSVKHFFEFFSNLFYSKRKFFSVFSTAYLIYHIFSFLSTTFYSFQLSRSVKHFFEFFSNLFYSKRKFFSVFSTAYLIYHIFSFLSTTFYSFQNYSFIYLIANLNSTLIWNLNLLFSTAYLIYHIFSFLSTTFYSFQNYSFIYLIANLNSTLIWNLNLQILSPCNSGIGFNSSIFYQLFYDKSSILLIILENLSFQHSASNRQIFIYILPPLLALFILKLLSEQLKNFLHYRNIYISFLHCLPFSYLNYFLNN